MSDIPQTRSIRCVLFDLGDTLWVRREKAVLDPIDEANFQTTLAILRERLAPEAFPAIDLDILGKQIRSALREFDRQMKRQNPFLEPDPIYVTQQSFLSLGFPELDPDTCAKIFEAHRLHIVETRVLFDDVLDTLAELKRHGYLLGVVTNRMHGGPPFMDDLGRLGLLDYFDPSAIAISADLRIRKPNPEIFWYSLRALGVSPEETAMVGDTLRADIAPAKQLDMLSIWKPSPRTRVLAQPANSNEDILIQALKFLERPGDLSLTPDHIIEHTRDLLDIL